MSVAKGGEKDVELVIKGNTNLPSEVFLNATNNYKPSIALNIITNKMFIAPSGAATSTLHVKVLKTTNTTSYTFPISANISFPTLIKNRFGESFNNSKSVSLLQVSNLTLTALPQYTIQEQLNNFVNAWITPIGGIWTFIAGVGTVITPLIIHIYRKKRKNNTNENVRTNN